MIRITPSRLAALAGIGLLSLTACSGGSQESAQEQPAAPPKVSDTSTASPAPSSESSDKTSPETSPEAADESPTSRVSDTASDAGPTASPSASPTSPGARPSPSGSPSPAAAPSTRSATPTEDASTPSPSTAPAAPGDAEECAGAGAEKALHHGLRKLNARESDWTWHSNGADTSLYDPCADLSPIAVTVEYATGSSPWMIMLFHRGEYLGTATAQPVGMGQLMRRRADDVIEVTYLYPKPGESNAARSGRAVSTFTWDGSAQKVVMAGDLPPTEEELPEQGREKPTDPPVDTGDTPPRGAAPEVVHQGVARILTPRDKIGCELHRTWAECGIESYLDSERYGTENDMPLWWATLPEQGTAGLSAKGDAPNYRGDNGGPAGQVLESGESVTFGDITCDSESTGLTCTNTASGHSMTMNKREFVTR
ncbi:LppP/LprE family lipoprotein [Kytococcus schroeteri]|uniref:LppP/LprE family lipoprotein n=1 Tax=Kytococcus schroeteri TaxID=138300 RepID=UPI0035F09EE6